MKTSDRTRVCTISTSFPQYGGDYFGANVYAIIKGLSSKYEHHVIYLAYPNAKRNTEVTSNLIHTHPIKYPYKTYPLSQIHGFKVLGLIPLFIRMMIKIRAVVKNENIDLIHAYSAVPSGFLASLCCGRKPLVITLLGSDIKIFGKKRIFKYPIKYALKKAVKIVAVSNDLKQETIKLGAEEQKISVIPAGVDTDKFKPMDKQVLRSNLGLPDNFLMLFAGTLIKPKRVDNLISICANLNKDFDFQLLIAGDGPEKKILKNLVKDLKLTNVLLKGEIPHKDMPLYMAASDVLMLASESEGLPGCVQEAMASGIPVVTSNIGGLRDVITNGINGYLTLNEAEMEERLRLLMTSPELVATMGTNALEFAKQNLSLNMVLKRTQELYASVLEEE